MGLRTADEYRESLRDGRVLWYRGQRVADVTTDPELAIAVEHSSLDFEVGHDAGAPRPRRDGRSRDRRGVQHLLPDPAVAPTTCSTACGSSS